MTASLSADPEHRRRFDRAVVLFNAGAYFEAHEDWETTWHEAVGEERRWLQGLIQLAAAFVHYDRGFFARGFAGLLREAHEKLADVAGPGWDLDEPALARSLVPWLTYARTVARDADLAEGAPAERPTLGYRPGYRPDPLPLEPDA